ncbi:uncharacterized protein LOC114331335 [Diabrotica virgifera virgifera]|uniref:Uncharacterized protein LOC114331335 n=1 Tax=Diabrotica virgifera virgifera TaxID=50390 RepID=A0A6P7FKH6_DIAVI|nr:uncharacterized protein LOC114331335 [Diabrotica virgifera virgifera]
MMVTIEILTLWVSLTAFADCSPISSLKLIGNTAQASKEIARTIDILEFNFEENLRQYNNFFKYNYPISYDLDIGDHTFGIPEQPSSIDLVRYHNEFATPYNHHVPTVIDNTHHLYSKQLFFDEIPHTKLLLENQKLRQRNHLPPHSFGSIRPGHPFQRNSYK